MKKMLLLLPILVVIGTTTFTAESYLGGTWNHGSDAFSVWSNYYHGTTSHYAAIDEQGGSNSCTMDSAAAGYDAKASQGQNPLTDQIARAGHGTTYC